MKTKIKEFFKRENVFAILLIIIITIALVLPAWLTMEQPKPEKEEPEFSNYDNISVSSECKYTFEICGMAARLYVHEENFAFEITANEKIVGKREIINYNFSSSYLYEFLYDETKFYEITIEKR